MAIRTALHAVYTSLVILYLSCGKYGVDSRPSNTSETSDTLSTTAAKPAAVLGLVSTGGNQSADFNTSGETLQQSTTEYYTESTHVNELTFGAENNCSGTENDTGSDCVVVKISGKDKGRMKGNRDVNSSTDISESSTVSYKTNEILINETDLNNDTGVTNSTFFSTEEDITGTSAQTTPVGSGPKVTLTRKQSEYIVKHFTGLMQNVLVAKPTVNTNSVVDLEDIDDGPFGSILWRDKKYLISVLIPIGVGITGAVLIIIMAYATRICKKRSLPDRGSRTLMQPHILRHDDIMLLDQSSDDEF